jgi:hypothetical protein
MPTRTCIQSHPQSLIIGPREKDYLSIAITSDGDQFGIQTYLHTDAPRLAEFFRDLAENRQGWSGAKSWGSIEGDFRLDATHDGLGHIRLTISLIKDQGEGSESRFVGSLLLDLGTLERVASEVHEVLA